MALDVERTARQLTTAHLHRLTNVALDELTALFARCPAHSGAFKDELMVLTLCQGAAKAYFDRASGIKDLDVWAFFRPVVGKKFPPRARLVADFGPSELGRNPADGDEFKGRRIDIMGRDINAAADEDALAAVRRYLTTRPTKSAWWLAKKPVICLWPKSLFGEVAWSKSDVTSWQEKMPCSMAPRASTSTPG